MSLARSADVLLGRANVISSRSVFRPAMFDFELEWTVEVGDGKRARRHLPEEAVEKKNTPWLVARHYISRRWAGNQSNWVKLKIGELIYELIFSTIYIFPTKILEYRCWLFVWQFFFHLVVNDSLKQQTAALNGLHAIICLIQTGILWWNDVAVFVVVFFIKEKRASPKHICIINISIDVQVVNGVKRRWI